MAFVAAGVVPALVIAVLALVLLGHRSQQHAGQRSGQHALRSLLRAPAGAAPRAIPGQITTSEKCRERAGSMNLLGSSGASAIATVSLTNGSIDGYAWDLRAKAGENGFDAVEDGRFVLDGHALGMCGEANPAEFALVDKGSRGIVYGYLANPGTFKMTLETSLGLVPVRRTRQVLGGTFFIISLPRAACSYSWITLLAFRPATPVIQSSDPDRHYLSFGTCQPNQAVSTTGGHGSWTVPGRNQPGPTVIDEINLRPPAGHTGGSGIVQELRQNGQYRITVAASRLPANTKHNAYAVWLYQSPSMSRLLGFVYPSVGTNGQLHTAGQLPPNASHYHEILITLETSQQPPEPSKIVLIGRGEFR
jgi:hypothetical protein